MSISLDELDSASKLRPAGTVMRLSRMGSFHQSRLSFMRVLLRRLKSGNWIFDRPVFNIDENGVGVATYRAVGPERTYTLVAFAHDLPDEKRSDRVIADAWDATFTLVDGEASGEDIERLAANVPYQEAGRISGKELSLSRANRSVRLFKHVKERLAAGLQPDQEEIEKVGYLMRTTAVYGSGKFGAADRSKWADRPEFAGSFQPELLSVWFTRSFAIDLVEHLARMSGGDKAVDLQPDLRRMLGIGNSTGLGMAPFLINHPTLIHSWIFAREEALARVRSLPTATEEEQALFKSHLKHAQANAAQWNSGHPLQQEKIADLTRDLKQLVEHVSATGLGKDYPWDNLYQWAEQNCSLEGQEQLVSVLLEPYGELIDDLAQSMSADETGRFRIDGGVLLGDFKKQLADQYGWAEKVEFDSRDANARIWYVSEEKLEPRLGERYDEEELEPYEQPLAPGRDAMRMKADLEPWKDDETVAAFVLKHPEHRHIVRRIQLLSSFVYAEIHDNTIASEMLPIDLLRCKLSFFGATKFDPRSDRWVRITMYQNAPYPHELAECDPDEAFSASKGDA